jgi:hypothetical protein
MGIRNLIAAGGCGMPEPIQNGGIHYHTHVDGFCFVWGNGMAVIAGLLSGALGRCVMAVIRP